MIEVLRTICVLAVALPIYGLFIFIGVKITRIENAAYGTSVKAALLAFIPLIIFISLFDVFHPLVASILAIFFGVIITRIKNAAYSTSVKAAFLAFILIIFLGLYGSIGHIHPLVASILATFILPFGIKRVFQTTYVPACLASVIVLCLLIVVLIAMLVTGLGVTHKTGPDGPHTIILTPI